MKLNIAERINLMNILPAEANYLTYKIITNLKSDLSFSEKETKDYNIQTKDSMVFWDQGKAKDKDVNIGEKATDIIVEALKKLDKEGKITDNNSSLYEKFIINT